MNPSDVPSFLVQSDKHFLTDFLSSLFDSSYPKSDVVLACSDERKIFRAHRCVLAAASPFFRHILSEAGDADSYITLESYSSREIQSLLELLYKGSTSICKNEEESLTRLLEDFEIGGSCGVQINDLPCLNEHSPSRDVSSLDLDMDTESHNEQSSDKIFKCKFCGQVLNTRTGLRLHLLVHKGAKQFTCDICGKGFSQGSQLKTHLRVHTGEKPYKCDVCNKSFAHASTLSEHKNLHTSDKPFRCNVCQQSFAQRKALRVHRCEDDSNARNKTFSCPFCNRSFTTRRGLGIHKMHQHAESSTEPLLQCDTEGCNQTFTSELAYEEHLNCHIHF